MIGLSPRPSRPSHRVALHMQHFGYRIVPIRPAVDSVLGEKTYATLEGVPDKIDLVDVFRAPEYVDKIVDECLTLKLPAIWLQLDVVNIPAALRARAAGMQVVMNRCIYQDYLRFFGPVPHP